MLPWMKVSGFFAEQDIISNNLKRRIGVRTAKENKLDYSEMHELIKGLRQVRDKKRFLKEFGEKVSEVFGLKITLNFF
jgi:hypothetical protein